MFNSLNKFKKRIKQAKVKSFSDDLLGKIEMFLNYDVEAKIINKDNLHIRCFDGFELIVTLENNDIIYQVKGNNQITIGKYGEYEDGYYVRINSNLSNVFEFNTVFSKNEKTTELFRTFDKHGFEQFRRFGNSFS